jgi:thiamine-phosphate pyrophosphorylase
MSVHQPQAGARRKLLAAARLARPAFTRDGAALPRAWFVTDPRRTPAPVRVAERLPAGFGVIYRHFGAADRAKVAAALARVCDAQGLVLLIAADPDLASLVGADGVHWPNARLQSLRARPGWVETASAHDAREIAKAARLGVDAVLVSPVFASASPSAGMAMGLMRFARLAAASPLPVIALGGIRPDNAARVVTHAAGWAAIDAVRDNWG